MSANVESEVFRFDAIKWLFVAALVFGGAFANAYYAEDFPLLYRVLALVSLGGFALFVAVNTSKGASFWALLKASQVELRKVVWPTRQEVVQTTLLVLVIVIIMAVILWGLDAFLGYLASLIIG